MSSRLKKIAKTRLKTASSAALDVKNSRQFENIVLDSDMPVVVDFWAPWCQPCKMQGPVFEAAAKDYAGKVKFLKVNTEANQSLAQQFQISSIPSLLVFDGGEIIDARVGLTGRSQLDTLLGRALDKHHGVTLGGKIKRLFGRSGDAAVPPSAATSE